MRVGADLAGQQQPGETGPARWPRTVALAGLGCLAACLAPNGKAERVLPKGNDAAPVDTRAAEGGGGVSDPDAATAPVINPPGLEVRAVGLPPAPVDIVPLAITIAGAPEHPVRLQVEVSLDGGQSYRPAHLRGKVSDLLVQPAGTNVAVDWLSLEDVGFHVPRAARLRVTAADARGASPGFVVDTPGIDNLKAAARHVQSYLVNYGSWDAAGIALAKKHDLVILHPTARNLPADLLADLKRGNDPGDPSDDVMVLCYISIGEDDRSFGLTDAQARADVRFRGDGTGPRIDPRGPSPPAAMLTGLDPKGLPSNGGTGWASYYVDDNSVFLSPSHVGDGVPDRNGEFGVFYVNAGDPAWFELVDKNLLDGPNRAAGLRELLTADYGRGFACDGLFLDTLDTVAPNSFTDATDPSLAKFEWTAAGMSRFVQRVRQAYPSRLLLQNRGLFYFDPRLPHFGLTTRGSIDFAFFESYRLGSRPTMETFHLDNRFNVTPKLMAEANRPDGFTVLSLGYPEGTGLPGAVDTLVGKSNVGVESLIEDIRVAQTLAGFRHYMTNADLSLVNSFVRDHSSWDDRAPPQWTSTYNAQPFVPGVGPMEPAPRVGLQEVVPAPRSLIVRWDVALDLNRVGYALYYQQIPFDFAADPALGKATRVLLSPSLPAAYLRGVGPNIYPYEATIAALNPGTQYHLLIRAFDASPNTNEDTNRVVLTGTPTP